MSPQVLSQLTSRPEEAPVSLEASVPPRTVLARRGFLRSLHPVGHRLPPSSRRSAGLRARSLDRSLGPCGGRVAGEHVPAGIP